MFCQRVLLRHMLKNLKYRYLLSRNMKIIINFPFNNLKRIKIIILTINLCREKYTLINLLIKPIGNEKFYITCLT